MTTLSDDALRLASEMRAGLEGVTPGPWFQTGAPWFHSDDGVLAGSEDGNIGFLIADCDDFNCPRDEYEGPFNLGDKDKDAAHIARCSPENIRLLLDTIDTLRRERDEAIKREDRAEGIVAVLCNERGNLEATIAAQAAEIARKDAGLAATIRWAESRCPCRNEEPNPCPLCGASVENLEACKSAENTLPRALLTTIRAALQPTETPATVAHPDDLAVDRFAAAMKAKLAKKRAEGRGGWDRKIPVPGLDGRGFSYECPNSFLSQLLREHVGKGDPVDVGNLAMMIHQRGERIAPTLPQSGAGEPVEPAQETTR